MTAPTFIAAGATQSALGAITVAPPAGIAAGDLLLLVVHTSNQAVTTPTNWTLEANIGTGTAATAGSLAIYVYTKIAVASEPSVTIADTGDHQIAAMYGFSDAGLIANIISATNAVATASTTYTAAAVTTVYPDNLGVVIMGNAVDSNSPSSPGTVTATGVFGTFTQIGAANANTGTGGGWTIFTSPADQGTAGIGSSGTITGTGTSSRQANITLAIPPVFSRASVIT